MNEVISNQIVAVLLVIGGLYAFGKNIVQGWQQLNAYCLTKKGQAAVSVGTFLVCFLILVLFVIQLR